MGGGGRQAERAAGIFCIITKVPGKFGAWSAGQPVKDWEMQQQRAAGPLSMQPACSSPLVTARGRCCGALGAALTQRRPRRQPLNSAGVGLDQLEGGVGRVDAKLSGAAALASAGCLQREGRGVGAGWGEGREEQGISAGAAWLPAAPVTRQFACQSRPLATTPRFPKPTQRPRHPHLPRRVELPEESALERAAPAEAGLHRLEGCGEVGIPPSPLGAKLLDDQGLAQRGGVCRRRQSGRVQRVPTYRQAAHCHDVAWAMLRGRGGRAGHRLLRPPSWSNPRSYQTLPCSEAEPHAHRLACPPLMCCWIHAWKKDTGSALLQVWHFHRSAATGPGQRGLVARCAALKGALAARGMQGRSGRTSRPLAAAPCLARCA